MRRIIGLSSWIITSSCDLVGSESACEAMCQWAVTCHALERDLDADARLGACLDATRGLDSTCAQAEQETLSFTAAEELDGCLQAVDERARDFECEPFIGTEAEIEAGTPPAQCVGAGRDAVAVFDAAREELTETSAELCDRVTDELCAATADCVAAEFGGAVPSAVRAAVGEPRDVCFAALADVFSEPCAATALYDPEPPNPAREAARTCIRRVAGPPLLDQVACSTLRAELDGVCGEQFASPAQRQLVGAAIDGTIRAFTQFAP